MDPATVFDTYEAYLDAQLDARDIGYLGEIDLARKLIEVGGKPEDVVSREEFNRRKEELLKPRQRPKEFDEQILSAGLDLSAHPLLAALADREELVRAGKLSTIVYIRYIDERGRDISGYIDYFHRLKTEDFSVYFLLKKRLMPKPTDLSYYDWKSLNLSFSDSSTFLVVSDDGNGLLFKHRRDRKVINVDPHGNPGDNSRRLVVTDGGYLQVVLFDHVTRRRN